MTHRPVFDRDGQALSLPTRLICYAALLFLLAVALVRYTGRFKDFTAWFLYAQDSWLLLTQIVILAAAAWRSHLGGRRAIIGTRASIALAFLVLPFCYVGHLTALEGFDLSRDEQMATFDARIFAHGLLVAPVPPPWRTHLDALNAMFILPAIQPIAWVSTYLPMNAALRALVGTGVDPALTGPMLTAVGALASWKCARLLWPDDEEASTLTLLLYLGSGQVLIAGMSAYAMPAHLALNMVWLWLFLLDRKGTDVLALAVGAVATGLHQPLFHPLFAAPFVVLLICKRAWNRAALFAVAYVAIALFWLSWSGWMYRLIEAGHPAAKPMGADFWSRIVWVWTTVAGLQAVTMSANLLRFVAWQPILLLPLFAIGLRRARHNALVIALGAAALSPVIAAGILMPDQGQGFGYRYAHSAIGAFILVAVYGWRSAVRGDARWRPLLTRSLAAGLLIILPAQIAMTRSYYRSFATVDRRIATSGVDYFIVGNDDAPLSNVFVSNRADLSNRPIRLFADRVDAELTQAMCRRGGAVGMATSTLYEPVNRYFRGGTISRSSDRRLQTLGRELTAAGCQVVPLRGRPDGGQG